MLHLVRFKTKFDRAHDVEAKQIYLTHQVTCEELLRIGDHEYQLMAKVLHSGDSLQSGHYFTICRHETAQGNWWYYNDTDIRLATSEDEDPLVARVYLCFYELVG